ncbi:MAG TPA: metal-dependent hydrolase, partial [Leclercia adecarboxylata]|nr:metal-dependent hydrolase [Leclercia adecarboxylata]
ASIQRAADAGVMAIVVPSIDVASIDRVLRLGARYPTLYMALGLHPIVIESHQDAHLDQLEAALAARPERLVAVGEIGLDLYREDPHFDRQEAILDAQLKLAKRYDL